MYKYPFMVQKHIFVGVIWGRGNFVPRRPSVTPIYMSICVCMDMSQLLSPSVSQSVNPGISLSTPPRSPPKAVSHNYAPPITPWGEGGEGGGALSLRRGSPRGVASVTWDGCRKLGSGGYPLSYGEWGTPRKPGVYTPPESGGTPESQNVFPL